LIEKEAEWILPENLKEQEKVDRARVEQGTFHGEGDFGSYYAYLKGLNYEFINSHAMSNEQQASEYTLHISTILKEFNLQLEGNIIDLGCAIGTITSAINSINKGGIVYGLDISEDAITVAKTKYPNCVFLHRQADELDDLDDEYFDVIHAREFYPFTRTDDGDYQSKYLKLFHSKLKSGGCVVLVLHREEKGFCSTYEKLSSELMDIGFSISKKQMVLSRVFKMFGRLSYNKILYPLFLSVSILACWLISPDRYRNYFFVLVKK
jgi:ubiquinone/menaquinone biosynthesis C-methylase UbiE